MERSLRVPVRRLGRHVLVDFEGRSSCNSDCNSSLENANMRYGYNVQSPLLIHYVHEYEDSLMWKFLSYPLRIYVTKIQIPLFPQPATTVRHRVTQSTTRQSDITPSDSQLSLIQPQSEELRAVRSAILRRTQYIDLECRRIRRLKEYNSKNLSPDTMDQNWRPSISVGRDVPEDDGYRIAEKLRDKYGSQLENVKAIGLSVSKGYHLTEDGEPAGLKWTDFLFQGKVKEGDEG